MGFAEELNVDEGKRNLGNWLEMWLKQMSGLTETEEGGERKLEGWPSVLL